MKMTMKKFLSHCVACGGNWTMMLASGVRTLWPEEFAALPDEFTFAQIMDVVRAHVQLEDDMDEPIKNLKRGDRFITRQGPFGTSTQDYFATDVTVNDDGMMIHAVSANASNNRVAEERELSSKALHSIWAPASGRWYQTWEGKKDGVALLDSVELPEACVLCNGVRSVTRLHGEPICIDCKGKVLDDRICDCAPYGQHIGVFCDRCGAAHSTKNIQCIGARGVHAIYEDSCSCSAGWFFHDCRQRLFVKGSVVDGKFVRWTDKYEEGRK